MNALNKTIILCLTIICAVNAFDNVGKHSANYIISPTIQAAPPISPEMLSELKDFKNLIPTAVIDELVAEHYLVDGYFRVAFKYLRSEDFKQLQKKLFEFPEIIDVFKFLHLTTANATTSDMDATEMPATATIMASSQEYNVDAIAVSYNSADGEVTTTSTTTSSSKPTIMAIENAKESLNNLEVSERPQLQQFHKINDSNNYVQVYAEGESLNAINVPSGEQSPLLHIVLLDDSKAKAEVWSKYYGTPKLNGLGQQRILGTFTTFVQDVVRHLPKATYQNMIKDKCNKSPQFAKFYHALRSDEFKELIYQTRSKDKFKGIISSLSAHEVDAFALQDIAYEVISWGPDV